MAEQGHQMRLPAWIPACVTGAAVMLAPAAQARPGADIYGERLGSVRLEASCAPAALPHLERGLALLHHMTYVGARSSFVRAAQVDPACAMAFWGQSMTMIHPLWSDPPGEAVFREGAALARTAATLPGITPREQAYIGALSAYWREGRGSSERPNLEAFARGWRQALNQYPDDPEIRSFTALAVLATADPDDKTHRVQRQAALIARPVLKTVPDHPGAHHYIIHAHDVPPLAGEALEVARSYGRIAPTVPHALHMPTHLFTRLGLWQDAIAMNDRSAAAALLHPAGEQVSLHYLHAFDYMAYAHLQRGEDAEAEAALRTMEATEGPIQPHVASAYALAAVPARIALERQRWEDAADLPVRAPASFPWDRFPAMEAISHFARALGAARSGRSALAREELELLARLEQAAAKGSPYWGKQVRILRESARAWLTYAGGDAALALQQMRAAADLEAGTEKHAVTPGEILPAQELLGDMLLAMERPREALDAYGKALERSPRRLNSLIGAARAAERLGEVEISRAYSQQLLESVNPDSPHPAIVRARQQSIPLPR